ncbi:MAG: MauE/DoxX family redox-associated membrane protein [Acidobacteriota bacterium]|nr:MauE/DoxX family redox-associated membrane protein [Acidobacteriota bacterium]
MESSLIALLSYGWCLLIVVYMVSSISKLRKLESFRITITQIPYMPASLIGFITYLIPMLELVALIGLLIRHPLGAYVAIGLHTLFILVSGLVLKRGMEITCNCFGMDDRNFGIRTIVENVLFIAILLTTLAYWSQVKPTLIPLTLAIPGFLSYLTVGEVLRNRAYEKAFK